MAGTSESGVVSTPLDDGGSGGAQQRRGCNKAEVDQLQVGVPDFVGNTERTARAIVQIPQSPFSPIDR